MSTFIPTLLTAIAFLTPSLALAQTPPPPATPGSHPTAVPPTKAPTKALPPAPLPSGQLQVAATSSTTSTSATTSAEQAGNGPAAAATTTDNTMLFTLIGVGILVLAGIGWFLIPRKNNPTEVGMGPM